MRGFCDFKLLVLAVALSGKTAGLNNGRLSGDTLEVHKVNVALHWAFLIRLKWNSCSPFPMCLLSGCTSTCLMVRCWLSCSLWSTLGWWVPPCSLIFKALCPSARHQLSFLSAVFEFVTDEQRRKRNPALYNMFSELRLCSSLHTCGVH